MFWVDIQILVSGKFSEEEQRYIFRFFSQQLDQLLLISLLNVYLHFLLSALKNTLQINVYLTLLKFITTRSSEPQTLINTLIKAQHCYTEKTLLNCLCLFSLLCRNVDSPSNSATTLASLTLKSRSNGKGKLQVIAHYVLTQRFNRIIA